MFFAMPVNTNLNKLFKEMELDKNHFHGIICIVLKYLVYGGIYKIYSRQGT